jgi:hypothetical protein
MNDDDDVADMLDAAADMYEALWVNPLREFLTAATLRAAVQVFGRYPQLRSPRAACLIDKFIREAGEQNDMVGQRHLRERRRLLSS